jgi:hypothetical protein
VQTIKPIIYEVCFFTSLKIFDAFDGMHEKKWIIPYDAWCVDGCKFIMKFVYFFYPVQ